ncbi:MAG: aminotransferase class V-fold PLP-dependent enzyme [Sphingomonadales bacterium]
MSNFNVSRRNFLKSSSVAGAMSLSGFKALETRDFETSQASPMVLAQDKDFWADVASHYGVTDKITNLENGFYGIMAQPVKKAYFEKINFLNENNSYFVRRDYVSELQRIKERVASFLNVRADEIVLTRGATETLQALIHNYNKLKPGDSVLYADLDYSEMKNAMRWLEHRKGVKPIKINYPEPASREAILEMYERAFNENPKIKMMLMTHLNNWTGQIPPVRQISDMARSRGIDVILDAAHSVGQVDFKMADLGCDFIGVNLHKWVGAPLGCGIMYIKKNRIKDVDTYMGRNPDSTKIEDRIDTGTLNFAAFTTIPDALDFHEKIGTPQKEARVRYLRNLWVNEVRGINGIQVLPPDDPKEVAALTSFRLLGETSTKGNNAIVERLIKDYGIFTCRRTGPHLGDCVRVTPAIYNNENEVKKLAMALKELARG